ncbi:MAG: hypothetical protein U0599_22285 [Vicinamibacteria bacterium]
MGLFNGNGRSTALNDNDKFQYDATRHVQPFGDVKYSEGPTSSP